MKLGEILGVVLMGVGGLLALLGPCAFSSYTPANMPKSVNLFDYIMHMHPFFCGLFLLAVGIALVSYYDEQEAASIRKERQEQIRKGGDASNEEFWD